MTAAARGLAPLRHRNFRLLVSGQLVSNFGDAIYTVALPWYVLADHGGVLLLGSVLTAYGLPRTALLVVGGYASDQFRPWTVMLAANGVRGLAVTAMAVIAVSGAPAVLLVVVAVVLGAGEGMFIPASETIVPALLPEQELQAGNALSFGTTQFSQLAGPAVGGVLIVALGVATGFAIDAATFVFSALALIGIQRDLPRPAAAAEESDQPDRVNSGVTVRHLASNEPLLKLILITDALLNLGSAGMSRVALPALAKGPLHLGAGGYGALSAAMGAGLLIGTISGSWLPTARRPLLITSFVLLPTVPLIACIPYIGGGLGATILLVPAFALIAIGNLLFITGLQQWAPPELLGRLTGFLMLASVGMFPASVLLASIVIHITGPAAYFPFAAASVLIAAVVQLSSETWRRFDPQHKTPRTSSPQNAAISQPEGC